jgi:hypothetical protein
VFQSDVDFSLLLGDHEKEGKEESLSDSTSNESDALLGRFIRRLTMVVVQHVPQFWGLALSVFTGKFGAVCIPPSCHLWLVIIIFLQNILYFNINTYISYLN